MSQLQKYFSFQTMNMSKSAQCLIIPMVYLRYAVLIALNASDMQETDDTSFRDSVVVYVKLPPKGALSLRSSTRSSTFGKYLPSNLCFSSVVLVASLVPSPVPLLDLPSGRLLGLRWSPLLLCRLPVPG